jgi:hypothetical protein
MGITVSRYCAAKSEMATFPPVSPKFANANWKPSLTTKIVFEGLNPRNPFYLTPYVTAGLSQVNELNGAGTDYKMSSKPKFDAGIDAKYSLTNNLTMDVTLNTDFAQVEADDQKINLTRYSLFFPEKRVFFQEKGDDYLTLRLAQTMENGSKNKMNDLSPSRVLVQWEKRKQKGFSYDFSYGYSGTSFNPGVGFEYLQNYQTVHGKLRYGWFPGENARILINRLSVTGYNIWDTSTGKQETASGMLTWAFEAKKGYSGSIDGTWNQEDLLDTLILGNDQAIVPPGRYSFTYLTAMYTTSASHALGGEFMGEAGNFYDGWKVSLSAAPSLNIGSGFNLSMTYQLDYVNFPGRNLQFVNHIAGIKGLSRWWQAHVRLEKPLWLIR